MVLKYTRILLIVIFPAFFTAFMIEGLYNFSKSESNFYFFLAAGSPFLIIMFGGLCKIIDAVFTKFGILNKDRE